MKRSSTMLMAVFALVLLAVSTVTSHAGSPPPPDLAASLIVTGADLSAAASPNDSTQVPEPTSLALFGIGISSFITLRRFRKLFY